MPWHVHRMLLHAPFGHLENVLVGDGLRQPCRRCGSLSDGRDSQKMEDLQASVEARLLPSVRCMACAQRAAGTIVPLGKVSAASLTCVSVGDGLRQQCRRCLRLSDGRRSEIRNCVLQKKPKP
eukprot:1720114-Amphidinium_carterae.1